MADVTISGLPNLTPSANTYIPLSNGSTTGKALTNSLPGITPIGGIIMWSGTIASIPSGWALCNGANGTPNLLNRFIIGANTDTPGGAYTSITGANTQTGGTKDAVVVSHTHTITDPGHIHTGRAYGGGNITSDCTGSVWRDNSVYCFRNADSATTGITVNNAGEAGTNQNLPPYYALAYIMRIS